MHRIFKKTWDWLFDCLYRLSKLVETQMINRISKTIYSRTHTRPESAWPTGSYLGDLLLKRIFSLMLILIISKSCSQRLYLLKLLRDQGLSPQNFNVVFNSLILSTLQYTLPAWSGFLSADSVGMVNSLLKRAFKYGYTNSLYTLEALSNDANKCLFRNI